MTEKKYLIGYRDGNLKIHYYLAMDCQRSRAIRCEKKDAPRFDLEMAQRITRQLPALDNRGWELVEDRPRCQFSPFPLL